MISREVEQVDLVWGALEGLETGLVPPCIQSHLQSDGRFNCRSILSMVWRGAIAPDPDLGLPGLLGSLW